MKRFLSPLVMTLTAIFLALGLCAQTLAAQAAPPQQEKPRYKGIFEPVSYPEDILFEDVFFVSEDVGWVSGAAGTILKTTDGGETWTPQLGGDPQSTERRISELQFIDSSHGWARRGAALLRTTDGENWEEANPRFSGHIAAFAFTSPVNGVYIYGDQIHRTQDGGKTWKQVFSCALRIQAQGMTQNVRCHFEYLHFPTPQVGYALARELGAGLWAVAKTKDGGETWMVWAVEGERGAKDHSAFFLDENTGYAVLWGAKLHRSTDGGQSWTGVAATVGSKIRFADAEVGWSPYYSNGHHLAWTTDGGKRWLSRPVALPSAARIHGFSIPSRQRAYVVGDHGMIYRYRVVPVEYSVAGGIDAPAMPGRQLAESK